MVNVMYMLQQFKKRSLKGWEKEQDQWSKDRLLWKHSRFESNRDAKIKNIVIKLEKQ